MRKTDKDNILQVSTALFREKGLSGTSMAAIADAAQLNKASLYHHFPSKDAILLGVLSRNAKAAAADLFGPMYDDSRPAAERMRTLLEFMRDYFRDYRICLMAHIALEASTALPEATGPIQQFFIQWRESMAYLLRERYGEERARELAADLIARTEGAGIWFHVFNDIGPLQRVCDDAVRLLSQ